MLITVKIWKGVTLKNVIFVLMLLKFCFVFGQNEVSKKVIIIDPGHGGYDTGAIGINRIQEKDVVLNIATEIIRLNKTLFEDKYDIYLTRYTDTLISLADRTKLAKGLKTDAFVSLHCNASEVVPPTGEASSKGIEVYVHSSDKPFTKTSSALGLSVLNENTEKLGFEKCGVKLANFQVLRETIEYCPAILIESGFLTNADEAEYFLRPKNIKAMALAILMGLSNYFNY